MSRFLRKHRAYDQRTGRLERAIDLIEDGDQKGLKVHKREADQEHPLRRPIKIGADRANLFPGLLGQRTTEDAQFRFYYGYTLGANLWEQRSVPVVSWMSGEVALTATIVSAALITSPTSGSVVGTFALAFELTASEPVTWDIVGGDDQIHFEISGSTLRWVDNGVRIFGDPQDVSLGNDYVVSVRATDGLGQVDIEEITITVTSASVPMLDGELEGLALNFCDASTYVLEEAGLKLNFLTESAKVIEE